MIWVIGERRPRTMLKPTVTRLAELCGVTRDELVDAVLWINLWDHPTRPDRYVHLVEEAAKVNDAVLLLGRRVQREFGLGKPEPLSIVVRNGGIGPTLVNVPHPSGLNRWYNDPQHTADASTLLRRIWGGHSR